MNTLNLFPLKTPTLATLRMPGSKSYTNRALIMAALTKGPVCLKHPLYSDDTKAMIGCLETLGLNITKEPDSLIVEGDISSIEDKNYELFAHDSGTTVRFLLALLCLVPGVKKIGGSKRLSERPIKDLVDALRDLGAVIEYCGKEGKLPVQILSSTLSRSSVEIKGDISSQFCSAVLLISPSMGKDFTVHIKGSLISKPYIDMTLSVMKEGGVQVICQKNGDYLIPSGQCYQKNQYAIEGDFSSAGYFFAIAALTKSTLTLENLSPTSAQADRRFLEILAKMGHIVTYKEHGISIEGKKMIPIDINMEDCPDQVMTLAVLAAFAQGVTQISGVRSLRVKESERVLALKKELAKMGIQTKDTEDTLTIYGGSPHGAEIETYNDHRIAMSFAVAGMYVPDMVICSPEVVNKTFPTFWDVLGSLVSATSP